MSIAPAASPAPPPEVFGPWNPGIGSTLPEEYLGLSTIFDTGNVVTPLGELRQLADFSGLSLERLTAFRPERLALHELLIRVMANLTVPDGQRYEDLGVNFRRMTSAIFDGFIAPRMEEIKAAHTDLTSRAGIVIDRAQGGSEAATAADAPVAVEPRTGWLAWLRRAPKPVPVRSAPRNESSDLERIIAWRAARDRATEPLELACVSALCTTADAIFRRHGRLIGDKSLVTSIATRLVGNGYGSSMIGAIIEPWFHEGARALGYRQLPAQGKPIVMNVKGASASGKSTMRPLQRQLAARLGVDWTDFALISPDIWRKHLLDYKGLGPAWRYAGMLTGREIEIIDRKLDGYMAEKASAGRMSHLLIDRFRFDSFAPGEEDGSRLLTRFGDRIYMFYMITPPEATVERAWSRGEQFGRYKAVDDLLAHNVEAYSGISDLFFTWVLKRGKHAYFEFLDNSVAYGETPRTVAFGETEHMVILDIAKLLDIDRYKRIDIEARQPDAVYRNAPMTAPADAEFLKACIRRVPVIDFVGRDSGLVYARVENHELTWWDRERYEASVTDPAARAFFAEIVLAPGARGGGGPHPDALDPQQTWTMGCWGRPCAGA